MTSGLRAMLAGDDAAALTGQTLALTAALFCAENIGLDLVTTAR